MKKRTKILATVGPSSDSIDVLVELIKAGVNVFRMNFSHGTHEYHSKVIANIREASIRSGLIVGILQDISGPKVRICELKEEVALKSGDLIAFEKSCNLGYVDSDGLLHLGLNHPEILDKVNVSEMIYLYDGKVRVEVTAVGDVVRGVVKNGATLSSKKGVNFPNTRIGIDVLTPKDREDIAWGVKNGVDFMAISFVQEAQDMQNVADLVASLGGDVQLFAKIEKFDAIENFEKILDVSDGIMVARGDLGIEMPFEKVPILQKWMIRLSNEASKPVITATQMLLSMTHSENATRAEISDVANAVLDGTDTVMLSEESAVGNDPVNVVKTMVKTIQESETIYPYNRFGRYTKYDRTDSIDAAVVRLADSLEVHGILTVTSSGQSAKKLSRYRPKMAIWGITHDTKHARQLTIVWGVVPAFSVKRDLLDQMLAEVMKIGRKNQTIKSENTYLLTAGDPVGTPGSTNLIRILTQFEMDYYEKFCELPSKKGSSKADSPTPTLF